MPSFTKTTDYVCKAKSLHYKRRSCGRVKTTLSMKPGMHGINLNILAIWREEAHHKYWM